MSVKLLVEVPANKDHCGFCPMISRQNGFCLLFMEKLTAGQGWGFERAQECKDAEERANK